MASPAKRWNIVETRTVEKRKTADGAKCVNNYALLRTLGHGRFAKVKLVERIPPPPPATASTPADLPPPMAPLFASAPPAPRRQFAVKIFSKKSLIKMKDYISSATTSETGLKQDDAPPPPPQSSSMRIVTALDRVRDEIAIMRSLYHRNIVLLFEVMEADDHDNIYLVLEYMPKGPCMAYHPETKTFTSPLTRSVLTEELARSHTLDILKGLQYLHSHGICHRDIKPDNILLNASGRCHLSDFGCALRRGSDERVLVTDTVGTYQFLAPECCSGEPYDPFMVDLWAVGVLLFIFLFGKLPFESDSTKELFDEILRCEVTTPETRTVSRECLDLLQRLMTKDPTTRISIQDAVVHPWLNPPADDGDEPLSF